MKGSKYLKITGILEIIIGIVAIGLIQLILMQNPGDNLIYGINVKETLWALVTIYAIAGFQIVAGILGVILSKSKKSSRFCVFLGLILVLIQVSSFGTTSLELTNILYNTVLLIIPAYFLYGAILNTKETK